MLSDLSPNTVCFFLLEDSSRVPQERDPRQRPLLAYLGVTKFELEFVLAPDQYLKNKWGLKAPGTHSEAPGVIPSSLRWTGAKFRIQQKHSEGSLQPQQKDCLIYRFYLFISFYQEMIEEGPLVLENGGNAFCVKSWAVGRALA